MKRLVMLTMAFALCCSVVAAQPGRRPGQGFQQRPGGGGPGGGGPGTPGSATLERAGLKLGQPLPDLSVFDEEGNEFRLSSVKGKHTVIVFGCLT